MGSTDNEPDIPCDSQTSCLSPLSKSPEERANSCCVLNNDVSDEEDHSETKEEEKTPTNDQKLFLLETVTVQQRLAIENLQSLLMQKDFEYDKMKQEKIDNIAKLSQQRDQSLKELENMVMKYAVSENSVLNLQRQMSRMENKLKEHAKEKDSLDAKIKNSLSEKSKLIQVVESKNGEILNLEREVSKKKDELNAQASNLKFFQNKLKLELESHKETQGKLEKMTQRVREAREETEQVRRDGQAMLREYEMAREKEEEGDLEATVKQLQSENNSLRLKIQSLETERSELDEKLSRVDETDITQERLRADLESTNSQLEATKLLLNQELAESARLRQCNSEALQELADCRRREAELLIFTQTLTEKNVLVQSELTAVKAKSHQLESDLATEKELVSDLSKELVSLKDKLEIERQQHKKNTEELVQRLSESNAKVDLIASQLEDQIGENGLLRKKHQASIKELTKELQASHRRGESSRTSSNSSLNCSQSDSQPELDRQLLIDKIDKVQRADARKQEKIDFLEEHTQQLLQELQRKSKIIQSLIQQQEVGALAPNSMDSNKAALAKHRGIMASVYSSKPTDDTMTLELSLEINQKLQAVLEDTLLKNITLKENMETLGNEIQRLTTVHR